MAETYEIRIKGHIDRRRFAWCEGLEVAHTKGGETILRGPLPDQAALHGLLAQVRDLGQPLLLVRRCTVENEKGV